MEKEIGPFDFLDIPELDSLTDFDSLEIDLDFPEIDTDFSNLDLSMDFEILDRPTK